MGDALSLNIAPQTFPTLQTAATSGTVSIPVTLLSVPDPLVSVTRPISINGQLLDLFMTGQISLKTSMGQIQLSLINIQNDTVKTLLNLLDTPSGKSPTVELVIQPGSPPKQATLIVPNNEAIATIKTEAPKADVAIKPPTGDTGAQAKTAITIKATVLPDDIDSKSFVNASPSTDAKAITIKGEEAALPRFITRITQPLTAKTEAAGQPHDPLAPQTPQTTSQPVSGNVKPASQQTAEPILTKFQAGQELKITVQQSIPPSADWPNDLPDEHIKATILGRNAAGQTIIRAEGKTLFLHSDLDLPTGTKLVLTASAQETMPSTLLPPSPDKDFGPARELAAALQNIDPKAAQHFMQTQMPSPKHHFGATALFFLSALHGGKLDEWMGAAAPALERVGKQSIKDKLIEVLKDIASSPANDPRVGEWKAYPIPLHFGDAFELLRLYVHRDGGQQNPQEQNPAAIDKTRFVITMNMSRLGFIQLDGLSQKRQLDLVIRSENQLPDHLTQSLRERAMQSLEAVGLTGTLLFQHGKTGWVKIEDGHDHLEPIEM